MRRANASGSAWGSSGHAFIQVTRTTVIGPYGQPDHIVTRTADSSA
jgi:hypothetical protein